MLSGILVLSGCATKKYVRQQVDTLRPGIQEAQNAGKENAERIDAVDKRAQEGITAAQTAAQAADQKAGKAEQDAQTAQNSAQAADRKADTANQGVQQANNRIGTLETRVSNIDNYTQSETQTIVFPLNSASLSAQAKSTLDQVAGGLSGQNSGYMLELEGYTDGTGSEQYNIGLSQRRAEAVERYLVTKNIPLFRMAIVGLGKENPIADNKTRDGRAQNRRVEVRVLKSAAGGRQTN
jgi:outer membrane protein OmpA-like peptidoglycan-associated protein